MVIHLEMALGGGGYYGGSGATYADNTLIMLQIMASNKEMFNDNICFNVKSIKCGFCTERLNISEFDTQLQSFLCYRCRYQQAFYPNN